MAKGKGGVSRKAEGGEIYTENKGVRTYAENEQGAKAFNALSGNFVHWNKGAYISKDGDSIGKQVKRNEMWDYLNRRDINSFIISVPKGQEQKALRQLSDYGYNVVAKSGFNAQAQSVSDEVKYFVSKKKMQYLGLDLKIKSYYKRGAKG